MAIERAIEAQTSKEKERAAQWAAAWGLLCGIKTAGVRLRRSDIEHELTAEHGYTAMVDSSNQA